MMVVPIADGDGFAAGRPQELWQGPYSPGMGTSCGGPGLTSSNYDVTPDGQRFLMIRDEDQLLATSDRVVLVMVLRGRCADARRSAGYLLHRERERVDMACPRRGGRGLVSVIAS